jgi:hypothetical protein
MAELDIAEGVSPDGRIKIKLAAARTWTIGFPASYVVW